MTLGQPQVKQVTENDKNSPQRYNLRNHLRICVDTEGIFKNDIRPAILSLYTGASSRQAFYLPLLLGGGGGGGLAKF